MLPFIPGYPPERPPLLARFLPPAAEGVAAHYIEQYTQPGDLLLDPFGQSPTVAREALHLGRRIVVASFNPIARLSLSLTLRPPSTQELRAALTALGDAALNAPAGPDRLEPYLQALYATTCATCEGPVVADAFEWEGDALLVAKHYHCPRCGAGSAAVNDADLAQAARFGRTGPDYHTLLNRVAPPDDPEREHAIETLAAYPARTLTALANLFRKYDAFTDRAQRRLLAGLLLAALDAALPLGQERPRVLVPPKRYLELNLWLALERAIAHLAGNTEPDLGCALGDLLAPRPGPGIYAHPGSVRELAGKLPAQSLALAISVFPRPTQAYWILSAVWAAWLFGPESAETLRALLRRRRYDWHWHTEGLARALTAVRPALGGPLVALLNEVEPAFLTSALTAAQSAALHLTGAALRTDTAEAQLVFQPMPVARAEPTPAAAMEEVLHQRAQPTRYLHLHLAAVAVAPTEAVQPENNPNLVRLEADPQAEAMAGFWWLRQPPLAVPLADRVEAEVWRWLSAHAADAAIEEVALERAICAAFPGPQTPTQELVHACLASYAQKQATGLWQLRPEDQPAARASEVTALATSLSALAERAAWPVTDHNPQIWQVADKRYHWVIAPTAELGRWVLTAPLADYACLVIPGGRAGLVEHKLRRDPRLRAAWAAGHWQVVKFRLVRKLLREALPTPAALAAALAGDPLANGG